jgi:hypothetical protein
MPCFPLQALPEDVQNMVVDHLHIHERLRLAQITRKYKRPIDKKLAVLHFGMKRNILNKDNLSDTITQFILHNHRDPTVVEFATTLGIELPKPSNPQPPELTFVTRFQEWLKTTEPLPDRLPVPTKNDCDIIVQLISQHATPLHFDIVLRDERYRTCISIPRLVFHILTLSNEDLFAHISKLTDEHFRQELMFMCDPKHISIYCFKASCIRLLLKYCNVSDEAKIAVLQRGCRELNYELVSELQDKNT